MRCSTGFTYNFHIVSVMTFPESTTQSLYCHLVCLSQTMLLCMSLSLVHTQLLLTCQSQYIVAERLSARQLILRRISEIVCMYVSVTLRNPITSRATRKRSITCASVTLRNITAEPAIAVREKTKSSLYVYTTKVRDVSDAVRTQRSGGQPEYEPIRAACNR